MNPTPESITTPHEFREGDLCRMPETAGKWARHGLAVIRADGAGNLWAVDTYWNCWDYGTYPLLRVAHQLEFIINLNDCRSVDRDKWEQYADADRAYIPVGSISERWYVRKEAQPDQQRVIEQLRSKIDNTEARIVCDQLKLERLRKELASLERP